LRWQNLVPDQDHSVVTDGLETCGNVETRDSESDYLNASRTEDGALVVAYMPTSRTITVNMGSLSGRACGRWFDPSNGSYQEIAADRWPTAAHGNSPRRAKIMTATETGCCCRRHPWLRSE
jgi:hypothetical protein